jgi:hypothetical protein
MGNYPDRVSIYDKDGCEYLVEIYDEHEKRAVILGKLMNLFPAIKAWEEEVSRNPGKRVIMRHRARVIKNSLERD